jgi:hypothetical protein
MPSLDGLRREEALRRPACSRDGRPRSRFTRRRRLAGESGKVSGLRNRRQRQRDA